MWNRTLDLCHVDYEEGMCVAFAKYNPMFADLPKDGKSGIV